ncbi:PREDICTED: Golgi-associated plant pathogenesis-related protein 1-like, partial [Nicrophorus vespilloides]|uniref:Golgi-associated plant pathogenesis-related protein 1-like n=1 Tax=Nicrophorus vespilloides TaxID=110193 RepID=A0ABM1MVH6_NICVS
MKVAAANPVFIKEFLKIHNEYRYRHGVEPLKLSRNICKISQTHANCLMEGTTVEQASSNQKYGENIYMANSLPDTLLNPNEPLREWYNEISNYDFTQEPDPSSKCKNFTQMIWKDSKEIGVGFVSFEHTHIVVASYSPCGNIGGRYLENVLPVREDT